ncbi:MAG TPA: hypothetical protein VJ818_05985 [Actinomycetota bacterium]|nr:hypothetical protein [Actinomycetota bacterium]
MLTVAIALVVVAATAAVVIRDAHPRPAKPVVEAPEAPAQPLVLEMPAAMPEPEPTTAETDITDAPTQSMPAPFAVAAGQAAALLPYQPLLEPARAPEPVKQPAAFVPAGTPYLQPDPDRLIQTEIVIENPEAEHNAALTKLVLGIAVSGTAVGLAAVAAGRGAGLLIHLLLH